MIPCLLFPLHTRSLPPTPPTKKRQTSNMHHQSQRILLQRLRPSDHRPRPFPARHHLSPFLNPVSPYPLMRRLAPKRRHHLPVPPRLFALRPRYARPVEIQRRNHEPRTRTRATQLHDDAGVRRPEGVTLRRDRHEGVCADLRKGSTAVMPHVEEDGETGAAA